MSRLRLRVTLVALAAIAACTLAGNARAQTAVSISAADLRMRLSTFAHDSMDGRETGRVGHVRATEYLIAELKRMGVAAGAGRSYVQDVPLQLVAPGGAGRLMVTTDNLRGGVDFVPVRGMAGVPFPRVSRVYRREFVHAGRLGDDKALHPSETKDKIVMFDAPVRENGQPDYQVWKYAATLALYKEAHAILVASLDFAPRAVIDRLTNPWIELKESWKPEPDIRPVALISRATAGYVRSKRSLGGSLSFESQVQAMALPTRNVVAVINGRDPALASSFVVVSAHTDHLGLVRDSTGRASGGVHNGANGGSGAVALLELAEFFAAQTDAPRRSIVFLWTAADEQGSLGEEFFAANPTISADRIYAHVRIDHIARAGSVACGATESPLARRNVPVMTLAGPATAADRRQGDVADRIDFERYAAATAQVADIVGRVAADDSPRGALSSRLEVCKGSR